MGRLETLGGAQGKHARSIGFDDGVDIDVVPKGDATEYNVSGITAYAGNQCVKFNDVVYAGYEDVVELTFSHHYAGVTINSCVNGDGTHGGFVANCQNNINGSSTVTFTNCAFDGQLLGANTNNWGGFVGWTEGRDWANVKTVGCLFAPAEVNVDSDGSATFSRGRDSNWSYKTIAGITVYVRNTVVTDVTATDITPTTATISWKGTDACSTRTSGLIV